MKLEYLIPAILVIIFLIGIFFISYIANKKTPVPEGCENLRANDENCSACHNMECPIKNIDFEKMKDELKEE